MDFFIDCPCGRKIRVTAADAGGSAACTCGRQSPVPALSQLRERAGEVKYKVRIADKIWQLVSEGALPKGKLCADCGAGAEDMVHCLVECERSWSPDQSAGFLTTLACVLISPVVAGNAEVLGRNTVVPAPLPVCSQCKRQLQSWRGGRRLRRLLWKDPLYRQLLKEYPRARLAVMRQAAQHENRR